MTNATAITRRMALAAGAGFLAAPALNIAVDPFGVLRSPWWQRQSPSLNERVWKVERLLSLPQAPQVLLMGSSVTDMLDPKSAGDILQKSSFNASVFSGTPASSLAILKVLATHGRLPRHVIMGVEPLAFHDPERSDLSTRDHWASTNQTYTSFLLPYLFSFSATESLGRLLAQSGELCDVRWDPVTGQCLLDRYEHELTQDARRFSELHLSKPPVDLHEVKLLDSRFNALAQLVRFTEEHGIDLHLFTSPLPQVVRSAYGNNLLAQYRRSLAKGTKRPVADFSAALDGVDAAWYDFRHYRPRFTRSLMEKVLRS